MYMAKLASRNGGEDPSVTYGDLAAVVQRKESMEFLHDILPKKVNYDFEYFNSLQVNRNKRFLSIFHVLLLFSILDQIWRVFENDGRRRNRRWRNILDFEWQYKYIFIFYFLQKIMINLMSDVAKTYNLAFTDASLV